MPVITAAVAEAAISEVEIVRTNVVVPDSGYGEGTVACPSGKKVLSGGFAPPSSGAFRAVRSYPSSKTEWTVRLRNLDTFDYGVTAFAVCAKGIGGWELENSAGLLREAELDITQNRVTIDATCPSGKVATGGGFLIPDSFIIRASYPGSNARKWLIEAANYTGYYNAFSVFVVCTSTGVKSRTVATKDYTMNGKRNAATAKCGDKATVGGGWSQNANLLDVDNMWVQASKPLTTGGWNSAFGGGSGGATTHAVCMTVS